MCTGPIGGELIPDQRRGRGAAAAIVDGVSPEPASRRLTPTRIKHGDRRIVGMDLRGGQADLADTTDDRVEQHGCLADPACQRRAINLDALRRHYLSLTVERQMMVELGDNDVGQRAEGRLAPRYRLYRCGCLHDLLAGPAAILGADGPNDAPLDRHGIEHLIAILP